MIVGYLTTDCEKPKYWQCDDGQQIRFSDLCNGVRDCNDGSDETVTHCFGKTCSKQMFRCR